MHLFLTQIKAASTAKVTSVASKEKVKQRPQALNTVELLRVASSALGISPHHTMQVVGSRYLVYLVTVRTLGRICCFFNEKKPFAQVAERLYTQGYISYPRTETTHYADSFDLRSPLKAQQGNSIWGSYVRELLSGGMYVAVWL